MVFFHTEPSDASVPKPSLRSTSSLASLTNNTTGTQKQNADEAISEVPAGEDDLGEDESAFDEEGILFGDSELISYNSN